MKKRRLLPYQNITYLTPLSQADVLERLAFVVQPEYAIHTEPHKTYQGLVADTAFTITRLTGYPNYFTPHIKGTIHATPQGTVVDVTLQLSKFTGTFMVYWLGAMAITAMLFIAMPLITGKGVGPQVILPIVMLGIGFALMRGGFQYESNIAQGDLQKIVKGKVI